MQRAAEENAKTFPACWRANGVDGNSVGRDGKGSESSRSTGSSGTESQSTSEQFSPNDIDASVDTSPESTANWSAGCRSVARNETATESCVTVDELSTSSNPSSTSRKLNLDDYRQRHAKPSDIPVDLYSQSTVVANRQKSHRRSESAPDVVRSCANMSTANTPGAKPRIKLKIGSEVVVKAVVSPEKRSTDVRTSYAMQHAICGDTGLSRHCSADVACVNGDVAEELNLFLSTPSVESAGHASSSGSYRCGDENGSSEPPSKRARMSFNRQLSSTVD